MNDSNIFHAISGSGGIMISAIDSVDIVSEAHRTHATSATVSAALGRALTGASLIGSSLKNEEDSVTLRFDGKGPVGVMIAVSDYLGNVRGCCWDYNIEPPLKANGKLDVGAAVGRDGTLSIIKDIGLKEPHSGSVRLVSGEIAEDITAFYAISEQIPTACALGVLVAPDYSIAAAGGFIAQVMPGASELEVETLAKNIGSLPSITELLSGGSSPRDIIRLVLNGIDPQIISEGRAEYRCRCSRERTENTLASLPRADLINIIEEDGQAEIICNFCNRKYLFTRGDLTDILNARGAH